MQNRTLSPLVRTRISVLQDYAHQRQSRSLYFSLLSASSFSLPPEEIQITSACLFSASLAIERVSSVLPERLLTTTREFSPTNLGKEPPLMTLHGIGE